MPQGSESVWQFSRKKSPAKQAHVALLGKVCEVLKQKDQKVSQMKIMVAEPGGSDCFDLWRLENWISVRNWDPQCKEHNQKIKKVQPDMIIILEPHHECRERDRRAIPESALQMAQSLGFHFWAESRTGDAMFLQAIRNIPFSDTTVVMQEPIEPGADERYQVITTLAQSKS